VVEARPPPKPCGSSLVVFPNIPNDMLYMKSPTVRDGSDPIRVGGASWAHRTRTHGFRVQHVDFSPATIGAQSRRESVFDPFRLPGSRPAAGAPASR